MSRNTRTLLVLVLALAVAGGASFMVYRAVQNIPVREVEVRNYFVAVAARPLPLGTMLQASDVKLVAWPAEQPGRRRSFSKIEEVVNRGLVDTRRRERADHRRQAGPGRLRRRPAADHHGRHAGDLGQGQRGHRRGRLRRPGHLCRRGPDASTRSRTDAISRVVLSNVQVLTAGTRIDQEQAKDGRAVPSTVVTLLVTPENAEKDRAGRLGRARLR